MKKLFACALLALASIAFGATTVPVQLLNPTGSTSGQVIKSTGPSTAPAWGNVAATSLAAQAANTVVANVTGSSASPTAFAMPSCSASGNALNWTTSTGFTCATGYALLASPTFTGTVTTAALTATGLITPSSTVGIKGTATNDSAQAGSVGECITATGTAVSLTTNTAANITSINLAAGQWDVWGNVVSNPAGTTTTGNGQVGISTITLAMPASPNYSAISGLGLAGGGILSLVAPQQTLKLASTTTVYLVASYGFATSTMTATGIITACRRR